MSCLPFSRSRGRLPVAAALLVLGLGASGPARGGTAYFADGRGLTVEDAWMKEGVMYLRLPGGGIIGTAPDRISRVLLTHPDRTEPAPPVETPGEEEKADLEKLIRSVCTRYGMDEALVAAVIRAESGFNPLAVSRVGAMGLMQLMPGTAADMEVTDPLDPAQNLEGGVRYLKWMMQRFPDRLDLALAAYNAGPAAVDRYGGVPPFPETRSYVRRILDLSSR